MLSLISSTPQPPPLFILGLSVAPRHQPWVKIQVKAFATDPEKRTEDQRAMIVENGQDPDADYDVLEIVAIFAKFEMTTAAVYRERYVFNNDGTSEFRKKPGGDFGTRRGPLPGAPNAGRPKEIDHVRVHLLAAQGLSGPEIARAISRDLGRTVTRQAIHKILKAGPRS